MVKKQSLPVSFLTYNDGSYWAVDTVEQRQSTIFNLVQQYDKKLSTLILVNASIHQC